MRARRTWRVVALCVVACLVAAPVAGATQSEASITFSDQVVDGTAEAVVDYAALTDGGFVALREGSVDGPTVGNSSFLAPGEHRNVVVPFDDRLYYTTDPLVAVAVRDTDADGEFDRGDLAYRDPSTNATVHDSAQLVIITPTPTPDSTPPPPPDQSTTVTVTPTAPPSTATPTPTPAPTATPTPEPTTEPGTPMIVEPTVTPGTAGGGSGGGDLPWLLVFFGAVFLVQLVGVGLVVRGRRNSDSGGSATGGSGDGSPGGRLSLGALLAAFGSDSSAQSGDSASPDGTPDAAAGPGSGDDRSTAGRSTRTAGQRTGGAVGADATGDDGTADPNATPGSAAGSGATSPTDAGSDFGGWRERVPEEIPGAPDVAVDYDSLTKGEYLGGGGNADVHLATVDGADAAVALKEPRIGGTLHAEQVERLMDEAETWERLDDHDHVVGLLAWDSQPLPWLAMEYMDGGHMGRRAGEVDLAEGLWTALSVARAVRHAHRRGVAHLDLKPENVLYRETPQGVWDAPKVADWGLSKHLLEHSKSVEGLSPTYAAPEQFDDSFGPTDDVTDVYGLGAVCYELFTGRPPFEGRATKVMRSVLHEDPTPPSEVDPSLPRALDDVLLRALAKDRADRYESILYLRDDLQDLLDGL